MAEKKVLKGVLSEGFGFSPKQVFKDERLSIESKAIYGFIASYAGSGATAYPSVSYICSKLKIGEKRFYKYRKELVEYGYLKVSKRFNNNRNKSNMYEIVLGNILLSDVKKNEEENIPTQTDNNDFDNGHFDSGQSDHSHFEHSQNRGTNSNSLNSNSINNNSNKKEKRKQTSVNKFTDDSIELQSAQLLLKMIKNINPKYKQPNLQKWADVIRLMIERDERDPEDIRKVIIFAQTNNFWKTNILSTQKLRDKFDTLMTQMLTAEKQTQGGQYNANNQRNKPQQTKQSNFQPSTPDW